MDSCPFCQPQNEIVLWANSQFRVILAQDEPAYPGLCRAVLQQHVKEMSDLERAVRDEFMDVVVAVERSLREELKPDKINLASLGNLVPHLHWHIIPRFRDDAHFPGPIWAAARRPVPRGDFDLANLEHRLRTELARQLG